MIFGRVMIRYQAMQDSSSILAQMVPLEPEPTMMERIHWMLSLPADVLGDRGVMTDRRRLNPFKEKGSVSVFKVDSWL